MKRLSVETSSSPAAVDGIDPLTSNKEQNQKKRRKQNDNTHVNDKTKDQREKDGLEQKTQQQQQDEKRNTAATNSCTRDDVPSEHLHQKHALADWSKIEAMLQGKKLAIFLDYDGTLTPIVNDPEKAFLSSAMRTCLEKLASKHQISIVTGRKLDTIVGFVKLNNLYYAGSHGFDIQGPSQLSLKQVATDYIPSLTSFKNNILDKVKHIKGHNVEDNKYSISVHYRNIDEKNHPSIQKLVEQELENFPTLRKSHGKMVWEVKPRIDWHKGKAVQYLINNIYKNDSNIVPLYLGDDVTDEDAFKELLTHETSLPIYVKGKNCDRRASVADFMLNNTDEVRSFLNKLASL